MVSWELRVDKTINEHDIIEFLIDPAKERLFDWKGKPVKKGMKGTIIHVFKTGADFVVEIHDPESESGEWIALIDVNISEIKKIGSWK